MGRCFGAHISPIWKERVTKRVQAILLGYLLAALNGSPDAAVIYVDHAATGAGDGTSWSDAYVSLQDALANASFGDEIWVTSGKHKPTYQADTSDPTNTTADARDATFWIPRGVQLYGGFAGTETSISQRSASFTHTILSGDIGTAGDDSDNSYRVVYYRAHHGGGYGSSDSDQTTAAVLDGFKVSGANADTASGAGIFAQSVTISPAVYNTKLYIANCVVTNNSSAGHGGGAYLSGWLGNIDNSEFISNHSDSNGGGVYISAHSGNRYIRNTVFDQNTADNNGGALARASDPVSIPAQKPLHLINCMMTGNEAGSHGGAVSYTTNGSSTTYLDITNCEISGNEAGSDGGGVYLGAGFVISQSPLTYIKGAYGVFHSSTFADNTAGGKGGGVFAGEGTISQTDASLDVYNSVLWGNSATSDNQSNAIVDMVASCIQGGGWSAVLGNISSDPLFYDAAAGDYSLLNGSPAIDAAWDPHLPSDVGDIDNDSDTSEELPLDQRLRTRSIDSPVADTGVGPAPISDMGAYELCPGDFNRDGSLNYFDVSDFGSAYSAGDPDADINGDGMIDSDDYSDFVASYNAGC